MNDLVSTNKLITLEELASILRLSKASVYRLVGQRKIPFYKISGSLRFKTADIDKYIGNARTDSVVE